MKDNDFKYDMINSPLNRSSVELSNIKPSRIKKVGVRLFKLLLIIFIIYIAYLLESLLFIVINLIFQYDIISIIICVVLNYLMVRYIALALIFPGQHWLFQRLISIDVQK
jgi:hypothetical protein